MTSKPIEELNALIRDIREDIGHMRGALEERCPERKKRLDDIDVRLTDAERVIARIAGAKSVWMFVTGAVGAVVIVVIEAVMDGLVGNVK